MSKPFSDPDQAPCKIVVKGPVGTEPAELRRLAGQMMGELNHFYTAQHQTWKLGEAPSHYAHKPIPGGRVRYMNNNGQETLYVDLTYGSPEPENPLVVPKPEPFSPYLAIDVLFAPTLYKGVEVSNLPGRTQIGENFGGPFVPSDFDALDSVDYYIDGDPVERTWGGDFPAVFLRQSQIDILDARPIPFNRATTVLHMIRLKIVEGSENGFPPYPSPTNDPANGGTAIWMVTDYHVTTEMDVTESTTVNLRNLLIVTGAVGDPEHGAYVAATPGVTPLPKSDGRLVALPGPAAPVGHATRSIPAELDLEGGGFGAGFLAMPSAPADKGVQSPDTTIDLFMASAATMKRNNVTEAGATEESDSPHMKYGYEDHVDFTVQAREFTYGKPGVVGVHTDAELRREFSASDVDGGNSVVTVEVGQTADWGFAADPKWGDLGDPNVATTAAMGMGETLATGSASVCIVGPSDIRRGPIYNEPEWTGAVTGMTRVARIIWKPSSAPGVSGTATIETFDGISCGHFPEGGGAG